MNKLFLSIFLLMLTLFCYSGSVLSATINFDDLDHGTVVTDQYSSLGINFTNTHVLSNWNTAFGPVKYTEDHMAYTDSSSYADFIFDDYISSFSLKAVANSSLFLEAYDPINNMLTSKSSSITYGVWNPMLIDLTGFSNVKKIRIHDSGNSFGFDDISFTANTAVPEPSTMILLGIGILGLAGFLRSRNKTQAA